MIYLDPSAVIQLIVLFILILLSAFFSSAETALTTVNKIRLQNLEEEGNKNAKLVIKLISNPGKLLSTILVGNNVVNLTASSQMTLLATDIFSDAGLGIGVATGIGLATGLLTLLILLFGEIAPKTYATLNAESISLKYARIIYVLTVLMTPIIFLINKIALGFLVLFRIDTKGSNTTITENELLKIIDVSHEEGVIEREEREMINNVVDFGDSLAKDVMVPRIDISFIKAESSYDEVVKAFRIEKYSRIPVYDESKDNVLGIVNLRDVFYYTGQPEDFVLNDILREPYFTYEYQKTSELLIQMRENSINIAIVLDEYGATAGLITLEDLLEEIVGDIRDEYDDEEYDLIQPISESEYIVDGSTKLDDLNDMIGTTFLSDDYDSIAGYIIDLLGHIPQEGEEVVSQDTKMVIEKMDKNRIEVIHIYLIKNNESTSESNTELSEKKES